ncbi:Arogenate dehydratase/prephenate dehydratase 1, chloroplastic [Apostasia shenzhenica]|uniref:Arogenate dehydratase n=1 Tax=Apostasia shenzhenica TaxID=1088818 RepID=A0A2H9ZTU1_9ASPA|nr:Arogenate dehydratase/prephenate dehydratase 1, chloroplastic [Apostasia shenzhenica]
MALRSAGGFCLLGMRDLGRRGEIEASPMLRSAEFATMGRWGQLGLCVKPVEDENASASSSSSSPRPTPPRAVEPPDEIGKWSRDLGPLPKPLSANDIYAPAEGSNVRVAYQGSPGAFSEVAALKAYPQCETVPCEQFEVVFKAVELWVVDKAVLPIENTVTGSIHRNYDLLLCHRLHIVGEVRLAVNHCLMALSGVKREELKRVLSHPQLVSSKKLRDAGAIASIRAAHMYGLNILEEGIQDCRDNVTRFLVLAREPIIPRGDRPFKTSIVFTLEEGPGMLFKALAVFAMRKINLTKIESRPQRNRPLRVVDDLNFGSAKYFDYLFHVDFEASMADPRAQNALSNLQVSILMEMGCISCI